MPPPPGGLILLKCFAKSQIVHYFILIKHLLYSMIPMWVISLKNFTSNIWAIGWVLAAILTLPSSTRRMELSIQPLAVQRKPLTQKTKNLKGREKLITAAHICNSWTWEANDRGSAWSWGKPVDCNMEGEVWKPVEPWSSVAVALVLLH